MYLTNKSFLIKKKYLFLNIYLQIFILLSREIFSIINNLILSKTSYQNIRYLKITHFKLKFITYI